MTGVTPLHGVLTMVNITDSQAKQSILIILPLHGKADKCMAEWQSSDNCDMIVNVSLGETLQSDDRKNNNWVCNQQASHSRSVQTKIFLD